MPPRELSREAETLRQRLLHVPGVKKVNIQGERPERIFVDFSYARLANLGVAPRDIFSALQRQNAVTPAGSIDTNGEGVLLTTEECLLSKVQERNPGVSREALERAFHDYLGMDQVIWLGRGIAGDGAVQRPHEADAHDQQV